MSTHSLIALKTKNAIECIYCHYDGYPKHHGPILKQHYQTPEAVKALLQLGDLSVLGRELGRKHTPHERNENIEAKNWCVAYERDYKRKNNRKTRVADEQALFAGAVQVGANFIYLFRDGAWVYIPNFSDADWSELPG